MLNLSSFGRRKPKKKKEVIMKKVLFLSLIISSLIYSTEKRSNQAKEVIDLIYNLQSQIPKVSTPGLKAGASSM